MNLDLEIYLLIKQSYDLITQILMALKIMFQHIILVMENVELIQLYMQLNLQEMLHLLQTPALLMAYLLHGMER